MTERDGELMKQVETFTVAAPALTAGNTQSDDSLRQALDAGEAWALAALYDRYATVLYSLALRVVNEEAVAQEVVQKVFLAAWQGSNGTHRRPCDLGAWLILLCRQEAIVARRVQKKLQTSTHPLDAITEVLIEEGEDGLAQAASHGSQLRQWVAALPEAQKAVIELACLHGMTVAEIAGVLELPEEHIETLVRKSLANVHEILAPPGAWQQQRANGKL
ncbi:MAG: RNA polymerase sigma factor [bacterium]